MKNYRALMPIVMILLMAISWYMLIGDSAKIDNSYNNYLSEARKWADQGIAKYAIENYTQALAIKDSPEVRAEVSDFYKSVGKYKANLAWCEEFFEVFPKDQRSYDCLLEAYYRDKDYQSCYDVLIVAGKRGISSDYIEEISNTIRYEFFMDYNSYSDVGVYSNNFCAVNNKGRWGFVDRYGNGRVPCKYVATGAFTQSGFASVTDEEGDAFFIDKTGEKVIVIPEKYESFGLLVGGVFPAKETNGKYVYIAETSSEDSGELYEQASGEYDYASTFNNGVAAVQTAGSWQLIGSDYKVLSEGYLDIKLDEKQIALRNDRLFVSKNEGKYIMVDKAGTQIGDMTFEDAAVFLGEGPTAVKKDGQWRFIDKDGQFLSDKTYDEARPYSNGMAAVCINGKWGFVDEQENIVIEPQFFGAKDFNEKGSCFVKIGDTWQLLKLYRLNRED